MVLRQPAAAECAVAGNVRFVEAAEEVGDDMGNQAVFEFGGGEAVPLSVQDGFEHGGVGIGRTAASVGNAVVFFVAEDRYGWIANR